MQRTPGARASLRELEVRKSRAVTAAMSCAPDSARPHRARTSVSPPRTAVRATATRMAAQLATQAATDEELVQKVLAGDEELFGELVRRHQRQIVNFIYRMVGDSDVALDMSQDVFIRVYQALDRFDPRYRFTTWIYRIASNCAIDRLRRHQPATVSLDAPTSPDSNVRKLQIPSGDQDPRESLESKETMQRLEAAIRRLPPSYRRLIVLRHVNSLRYEQIAAVTRLPLGTVKTQLHRAKQQLRRLLETELK